jgi:OmcA/MtrC family decaheme c-type cytochrome
MLKRSSKLFLVALMLVAAVMMFGCGSDGDTGPAGPPGPAGQDGKDAVAPAIPASSVEPETCVICHGSVDQTEHQSIYNKYKNADSSLKLTIDGVASTDNGDGTFDATLTFTVKENGVGLTTAQVSALDQLRFKTVIYDSATDTFDNAVEFDKTTITEAAGDGQFTILAEGISYAPELSNAEAYGYAASDELDTEILNSGSHVHLYGNVASAGNAYGDVADYESPANVTGCEKCHGTPYRKHGYREAHVAGLSDFSSCKVCHYSTYDGNAGQGWQQIVYNPLGYANGDDLTAEEEATYAYKANIMNDVHMSHSMEFPYPQNIANCATCHEGKLDIIQADENFTLTTCKSCHPVTSTVDDGEKAIHEDAAPSLQHIWSEGAFAHNLDFETVQCNACHSAGNIFGAPLFGKLMPGYDPKIYTADNDGTKYSDIFKVSIDDAAYAGNILTVSFSVYEEEGVENTTGYTAADIVPYLQVGLYGYGTKDFIAGHNSEDENEDRILEGDISENPDNPYFTIDPASGGGTWVVNVDLSHFADQIDGVTIKRAEIMVRPALRNPDAPFGFGRDGITPNPYALNAPSKTFDFTTNTLAANFGDFFGNTIVDVQGCNNCHDALATTFHSADRGGNVTVCRYCHESSTPSSHLELEPRAIDSYVHAIHSFQALDIDEVDFTNDIEIAKYNLHVGETFPNFTAKNCEACHKANMYMVPDESKSLSAVLSASADVSVRNLAEVPSYVTGPAYRSCGGCHRADLVGVELVPDNKFEPGKLIALNNHAKDNGYLVEIKPTDDTTTVWDEVVKTIQAFFK